MWFFGKKECSSMVLITVSATSVSGAYVHYRPKEIPVIYFTAKRLVEPREGEDPGTATLRTLEELGTELIETGAPALRREIGSGHVDGVLVSVSSPWQETKVRTQTVQPGKPFTFTKKMLSEIVSSSSRIEEDRISFGESVIATILNGYDIPDAIGKTANRAEVVILSSTLDKKMVEEIKTRVRKLYHTHIIAFTGFAPVAYAVIRDLYPHEKDFLILDVGAEETSLAFVRAGLLVDVGTSPLGINSLLHATRAAERMTIEEEQGIASPLSLQPGYINPDRNARFAVRAEAARDEWLKSIADILRTFAQHHALPRTLFLMTETESSDYLKRALHSNIMHALWLSDEPLTVIPVSPEQFSANVRVQGEADGEVFLSILALYQKKMMEK